MSVPMPGVPINPFDAMIGALNSNPYFIGTMMLMLNLGGRFISLEMSRNQEALFQNPWIRRILIFVVLFVGTRNVMVAFWMSVIIILLLGYLFNENSSLCLFHFGAGTCGSHPGAASTVAGAASGLPVTPGPV